MTDSLLLIDWKIGMKELWASKFCTLKDLAVSGHGKQDLLFKLSSFELSQHCIHVKILGPLPKWWVKMMDGRKQSGKRIRVGGGEPWNFRNLGSMTSNTVGMLRSLWDVQLETYHGALRMVRRTLETLNALDVGWLHKSWIRRNCKDFLVTHT